MHDTKPGQFIYGGFRKHGFITDRQPLPAPTMVTRHSIWQDSLGRYWRAAGRLPFGLVPHLWVATRPVPMLELAEFHRRAVMKSLLGALASVIVFLAAAAVGMMHAPLWLCAMLYLTTGATAGYVSYFFGRTSRRRDGMFALPEGDHTMKAAFLRGIRDGRYDGDPMPYRLEDSPLPYRVGYRVGSR